jgi:putative ABC transport system substrate-binding protein
MTYPMPGASSRLGQTMRRRTMRRRDVIALTAGMAGLIAVPRPPAALAQVSGKVWRLGFLLLSTQQNNAYQYAGFRRGMGELGYVEGKDFVSEHRFAEGRPERLPELAEELLRQKPDVLLTGPRPAVQALMRATRTIPIVGVAMTDPIGNSLVASLAQPGGNLTGSASSSDDTSPKQLDGGGAQCLSHRISPQSRRRGRGDHRGDRERLGGESRARSRAD